MQEDILYQANFTDPREQEIEATTMRLYSPALKELGYGIPLYVLVYTQTRYYEDYGRLKVGYSIAGKEALAKQFGVTVKQIEKAYDHLTNTYKLGSWVVCDEKIFRNVKKVWVSNVRQARGTMEDAVKMIENSHTMGEELPYRGSKTPILWELATEVPPLSESKEKVTESEATGVTPTVGTVFPRLKSKFKKAGFPVLNSNQLKEKLQTLLDTFGEEETLTLGMVLDAADNYINGNWKDKSIQKFLSLKVFPYCVVKKDSQSDEKENVWS